MEQEEIIHRYYVTGTTTLNKVVQVLAHLTIEGLETIKQRRPSISGETNYYKLYNQNDPLASQYLHEKVDLQKVKAALFEQGLGFAFKPTKEGTILFFRVKDHGLAKQALKHVLSEIKKNPTKLLKTPTHMSFEEKVAYAKQRYQYTGSINKSKAPKKGVSL